MTSPDDVKLLLTAAKMKDVVKALNVLESRLREATTLHQSRLNPQAADFARKLLDDLPELFR